MSIESEFFSAISGDPGVTALIGTRLFPLIAPDKAATPYVTYQNVTGQAYNKLSEPHNLERKVLQINCIANSLLEAKSIAEAIKAALHAHKGYLQNESDEYFDGTQKFRVRIDWSLIG